MLRKCGIEHLYFTGIVTNGGVASTVRDAHVREFHCTVIADGCAAFSRELHDAAIEGLKPVAKVITVADAMRDIRARYKARMARFVFAFAVLASLCRSSRLSPPSRSSRRARVSGSSRRPG